jgi:hypothetical protein
MKDIIIAQFFAKLGTRGSPCKSNPIRYTDRSWGPTGLSNVTILLIKRSFKIPGIKASCKAGVTHFAGSALCSQFMRDTPNEAHAPRTTI